MKIVIFLFLLLFLAAVGHDLYINYIADEERLKDLESLQFNTDKYEFSDLGWVIKTYLPGGIEQGKALFTPESWDAFINPVLQTMTVIVAAVPLAIAVLIWGLIALVQNRGAFFVQFRKRGKNDFAVYKHAQGKAVKYKRK